MADPGDMAETIAAQRDRLLELYSQNAELRRTVDEQAKQLQAAQEQIDRWRRA